ncbi:hypothetical protein [Streptomyces sp. NPDC002769]|uniref:hypothetical protein n=1 Tax=Streptomyces sp. NPDC002769 TaxID=3154542 RepID=UPI00331B1758
MNELDKGKAVRFYVVAGMAVVVIGRIALFSQSVINRAGSIALLIFIALLTRHMITLHKGRKR